MRAPTVAEAAPPGNRGFRHSCTLGDNPAVKPAAWLQKFGNALERGEIDAAAALFEPDGYWRDLVAFTWNIKTCEGRGEIKAMLAATLAGVKPGSFVARGDEWFTFETAVGRGVGHLRLRDKRCWTLLTTLQELKGFEEKREQQ
jgi:putative flavoprotein involved in K+ transport